MRTTEKLQPERKTTNLSARSFVPEPFPSCAQDETQRKVGWDAIRVRFGGPTD
jgi:hypothetical protein